MPKLRVRIDTPDDADGALELLKSMGQLLLLKALQRPDIDEQLSALESLEPFVCDLNQWHLSLERRDHELRSPLEGTYDLTLQISV